MAIAEDNGGCQPASRRFKSRCWAVSCCSSAGSGSSRSRSTQVPRNGRQQSPADAAAARPAGSHLRSPRTGGRRQPTVVQHLDSARAQQEPEPDDRGASSVTGVSADEIREIVARHRHEPSYRPIVVIADASLDQIAAVAARRWTTSFPRSCGRKFRRASILGRARRAPRRLRRRGEETQGQETGLTLGAIVGQTGVEKNYNQLLMGKDGAARRRQQPGAGDQRDRKDSPVEGRRVQLTLDLRDAEGGRGRVSKVRLLGVGDRDRPRAPATC